MQVDANAPPRVIESFERYSVGMLPFAVTLSRVPRSKSDSDIGVRSNLHSLDADCFHYHILIRLVLSVPRHISDLFNDVLPLDHFAKDRMIAG